MTNKDIEQLKDFNHDESEEELTEFSQAVERWIDQP
jgi:hypothetical protein